MTDDGKPREFWIEQLGHDDCIVHFDFERVKYKAPEQVIHVIEKSAYDDLAQMYAVMLKETTNLAAKLKEAEKECSRLRTRVADWENGAELNETYIDLDTKLTAKREIKVGDKVRLLKDNYANITGKAGDVFTVENAGESEFFFSDDKWGFRKRDLGTGWEFVEEKALAEHARSERLVEALKFYANPDNYDTHSAWGKVCILERDTETGVREPFMNIRCGGKTARKALAEHAKDLK